MLNFILMLFFALLRVTAGLAALIFGCAVMTGVLATLFIATFIGAWLASVTAMSIGCYRRLMQ